MNRGCFVAQGAGKFTKTLFMNLICRVERSRAVRAFDTQGKYQFSRKLFAILLLSKVKQMTGRI